MSSNRSFGADAQRRSFASLRSSPLVAGQLRRYTSYKGEMMLRLVSTALLACVLLGCATVTEGDHRYQGVIERTQKISRAGEPSGVLMAFGAIGGLLHHAASQPTPTNLYFVRTASGEIHTVQVDEEFPIGSCVEVIPGKSATPRNAYTYGDAKLIRSDRCRG